MAQTVYVVQPFSRDGTGTLIWDAPTWSQDRSFAMSLTHSLSKRKAGVVTIGVILESSGELSPESEIVGSYGTIPTAMILPACSQDPDHAPVELNTALQRRA